MSGSDPIMAAGGLHEEDRLRANLYGLLAGLLVRPPDGAKRDSLKALDGDFSPLGEAIAQLSAAARDADDLDALRHEYNDLFIGVGRGELLPYGSYYLTGFLHEKPLARLRASMAQLGLTRTQGTSEPEDHIAALMEMMAGLIDGRVGKPQPLQVQRAFFADHVGKWAPHFFKDLEQASNARFYRPVGTIGRLFMDIEQAAFEMG